MDLDMIQFLFQMAYNQTFGEMESKLKMSIDHRFKAFLKIKKFFI